MFKNIYLNYIIYIILNIYLIIICIYIKIPIYNYLFNNIN